MCLAVKDIAASRAFYEKLGFEVRSGDQAQGWLVLKGPTAVIGLFQGLLDRNTLNFCPGWDANAQTLDGFTDVRDLQRALRAAGLAPDTLVDETGSGPGYFTLTDPDGNPVLIDQHV